MPSRKIKSVSFNHEARELHELVGAWNAIKGVAWRVTATDYVGGCFDVTFSRSDGAISKAEAQVWIDAGIKHARD